MKQRSVWTENGNILYTLTRKKIKRLNLRIGEDGSVMLSVPLRCTCAQADEFVAGKSGWIATHLERMSKEVMLLPELERDDAYRVLLQAVERAFPLVEPLGVCRPQIKIRNMRAQWGNCHWEEGYITLNTALHRCPEHLRVYVALHELVHFLHHNHGSGFYALMDILMPDWKLRRKELRDYACAIRK